MEGSCHTKGFSEAIDSAKLPSETEKGKGECIELDECDEIDNKNGESKFIDTTLTGKLLINEKNWTLQ